VWDLMTPKCCANVRSGAGNRAHCSSDGKRINPTGRSRAVGCCRGKAAEKKGICSANSSFFRERAGALRNDSADSKEAGNGRHQIIHKSLGDAVQRAPARRRIKPPLTPEKRSESDGAKTSADSSNC